MEAPGGCEHLTALRAAAAGCSLVRSAAPPPPPPPPARAPRLTRSQAPLGAAAAASGGCWSLRGRLACLACDLLSGRAGARAHAAAAGARHSLHLDVGRAELYCALCGDYKYDTGFDSGVLAPALERTEAALGEEMAPPRALPQPQPSPWAELGAHLEPPPPPAAARAAPLALAPLARVAPEWPPLGLRGVNNLGNSCFLSSVLQALLTLPSLQRHCLAGGHASAACAARAAAAPPAPSAPPPPPCLACALDDAFQAAFARSGGGGGAGGQPRRAPWSPAPLLAAWWRSADWMAAYAQQDAHEFFISLLNGAHSAAWRASAAGAAAAAAAAAGGAPLGSPVAGGGLGLGSPRAGPGRPACACVWHATFGGAMRSDVTCAACGGLSSTGDPFVDISLEVPGPGPGGEGASLHACLRRFTRAERLGPAERIHCRRCGGPQIGAKQLSLARCPPVLAFHLKRFLHRGGAAGAGGGAKVDTHVAFPLDGLDMTPYCSAALLAQRVGYRAGWGEALPAPRYALTAAVCHNGRLEGGHYVAYSRWGADWFRCDDATVTAVGAGEVSACQAYMLFYAAE